MSRLLSLVEQNDQFRSMLQIPQFGMPEISGHYMLTSGISALEPTLQIIIMAAVRAFDDFTPDNDPYGEHDFGSVIVGGVKAFWKIDYYDHACEYGSPDPSDPSITTRVLTVMLASEY